GAGKTTIFDAITYALYGRTSGESDSGNDRKTKRTAEMLISKYAPKDVPSSVSLTFLHCSKKYTVTRTIGRKRNGEPKNAEAELILPDGGIVVGVREVTGRIEDILKLDKNRFSRIAMIAQGDFLKLLLADTSERQEIFRSIFKTDIYVGFTETLSEKAAELKREIQSAEMLTDNLLKSVHCGEDDPRYARIEEIKARGAALLSRNDLSEIETVTAAGEKAAEKMQSELARLEKLILKLSSDIAESENLDNLKTRLEEAKKLLARKREELSEITEKCGEAESKLPEIEELKKYKAVIESRLNDYAKMDGIKADIKKTASDMAADKAASKEKIRLLDSLKEKERAYENELDVLKASGENAVLLERKAAAARSTEKTLLQLISCCGELERSESRLSEMKVKLDIENVKYEELKANAASINRIFISSQAGIMALGLHEGEPCPVCGSVHHPKKAAKPENSVSEDSVKRAEAAAEKAGKAAERAAREYTVLSGNILSEKKHISEAAAELFPDCGFEHIKETAEKNLVRIRGEINLAAEKLLAEEKNAKRRELLEKKLIPEIRSGIKECAGAVTELEKSISAHKARTDVLEKQLRELDEGLPHENIAAAEREAAAAAQKIKRFENGIKISSEAQKKAAGEIQSLEGQISSLKDQLARGSSKETAALKAEQERLIKEKNALRERYDGIKPYIPLNKKAVSGLSEALDSLGALNERYRMLDQMSKTAKGQVAGGEKITLEAYVQGRYFDKILHKANVRLTAMSGGRFSLRRQETADNNRSGFFLNIDVTDHYNGSIRSVKTLSGGESFLASLSLALGLSEEVQESAGGIRLDSMFIDEGFGTLDEETLRQAMQAMASLADGSRLIGIISHVSELRREIVKQINVKKNRSGGSTAVVSGT
ncbi:MAG: SMC family ATPase, partial [Ruminococcus sp.]|nr:SMC family ATPase [Ruminococcus sp.]